MTDVNLGFVGVGVMGSRMATNLIDAGFEVTVFDLDESRVEMMEQRGASAAESAEALARDSDVVMSSLPTIGAVEGAYHGEEGILEGATEDTLLIELSTITPNTTQGIAEAADEGVDVVDAPVIGLPPNAADATLSVVVGGSSEAFDRAKPILQNIGNRVDYVGELGNGNALKLVNNVMAYGNFAVAAEAFSLANQLGLDKEQLLDIAQSGGASSHIVGAKMPKAFEEDYDPGFAVKGVRKDVKYALESGYHNDVSMPLTAGMMEQYGLAMAAGEGEQDFSVLLDVLNDING